MLVNYDPSFIYHNGKIKNEDKNNIAQKIEQFIIKTVHKRDLNNNYQKTRIIF